MRLCGNCRREDEGPPKIGTECSYYSHSFTTIYIQHRQRSLVAFGSPLKVPDIVAAPNDISHSSHSYLSA